MEKEMYELTSPQNNIWLIDRVYENSSINLITGITNIEKDFSVKICKEEIEEYIKNIAKEKIDIFSSKLYDFKVLKYSNDRGAILLRVHHIISDAWSVAKITEQFTTNYNILKENKALEDETKPSYLEFINSQKEYINSDKYIKDEEYFKEYLKDINDISIF